MINELLEEQYIAYLESLSLATLRHLGRRKGVSPSLRTANKPELIAGIVDILMGRSEPIPSSGRGAPVKSNYFDPTIIPTLDMIRMKYSDTPPEEVKKEAEKKPEEHSLRSPLAAVQDRAEKEPV